jgi:hypothetical protein
MAQPLHCSVLHSGRPRREKCSEFDSKKSSHSPTQIPPERRVNSGMRSSRWRVLARGWMVGYEANDLFDEYMSVVEG